MTLPARPEPVDQQPDQFSRFYRDLAPKAYAMALGELGNEDEAKDAVQEAWYNFLKSAGQFRGEAKLSTWFYRILYNECFRIRTRRRRRGGPLEDLPEHLAVAMDEDPLRAMVNSQNTLLLRACIHRLPEKQGKAIRIYYLEERSLKEVGEALNTGENSAAVTVSRARRALTAMFAKLERTP
jgi:RNA polymerase sigma-70 factor (ECF subfamily)